jgi:hypothetical protein
VVGECVTNFEELVVRFRKAKPGVQMQVERPFPVSLATLGESFTLNRYVIICEGNVLTKRRAGSAGIL